MADRITAEKVAEVKHYAAAYPNMTNKDLAKLCGIGATSVGEIKRGNYDGLESGPQQPRIFGEQAEIAARLAGIEALLESIFEFMVEGADK